MYDGQSVFFIRSTIFFVIFFLSTFTRQIPFKYEKVRVTKNRDEKYRLVRKRTSRSVCKTLTTRFCYFRSDFEQIFWFLDLLYIDIYHFRSASEKRLHAVIRSNGRTEEAVGNDGLQRRKYYVADGNCVLGETT